jgi:hypothetical protein
MTAVAKTESLQRLDIPIGLLVKNEANPNKMRPREFDLLVDNITATGLTDPVLVRPLPKKGKAPQKYRIVGGHHRYEAAAFLDFEKVPCTVITDPNFDEDAENFQLVRMNVIRGRMDPQAFFDLYQGLSEQYTDDVLQDAFGFAEEAEFQKLINQMAKTLPEAGLQKTFKEAAKEIKTIDGLSRLLNDMFAKYGDTLPFGFMVFDHGGQRSVWLQVDPKTITAFDAVGKICIDRQRTADDLVGQVVRMIAAGDLDDLVDQLVAATPEVEVPQDLKVTPTKENLGLLGELP